MRPRPLHGARAHLGYLTRRLSAGTTGDDAQEDWMSFEKISLLLNWMEMGALLAILFRLSST